MDPIKNKNKNKKLKEGYKQKRSKTNLQAPLVAKEGMWKSDRGGDSY
jgi:hypothetical protein